ncbi:cell wall-active antibiotics response protein [Micromonospora sp. S-DT3-3-22]|uniref:cell wall-active antibiotics response protein n=1 Tax=Micromonospora sp. S-DT3-3-22 TaxID=2755359 RepID=UPI001E410E37|nr:cell wall-active antibiotics response protein [Micromonospora sp. S-DT3-3-22]
MAEPGQEYRPATGEQRPVFEPVIEVTGEPVEATGDAAYRSPRPRGARLLAAAAALVVALGAIAVVVTMANPDRLGIVSSGDRTAAPPAQATADPGGAGAAEAPGRTLTAPADGLRRATFELMDGVTSFRLRTDDLGADLYRISSPADAGLTPRPQVSGDRVQLRVTRRDRPGRGVVDVTLNARVTWRLRLIGGVSDHVLDLTGARLSGVELIGGAARIDLRLPPTTGTRTVRMTGGVNQFVVHAPGGPPVRVRAASGAGSVVWYGDRRDGLARGATVGSPNWDRSPDRLYLDLVEGANTVTVVED